MDITILTLFPNLFTPFLSTSIPARAAKKGLVNYQLVDIRTYGKGVHQVVDGRPFGGGPGMLLRADILAKAWKSAASLHRTSTSSKPYTVLMSASGKPFNQDTARKISRKKHLIIVCGHYEGVDQRFIDKYVSEEICVGDFVLSGGELPAMMVADAVVRLVPGVLKKDDATVEESFSEGLLEYPQYTRPAVFEKTAVPGMLLSGNHQEIDKWRREQSLVKTQNVRPELLKK